MTYITPGAMALRIEYERSLIRSGRRPARIETRNYQTHPRRQTAPAELVRAMTTSPMARRWLDPRLGTGNAGQSTVYMGGMGALGDEVQDHMDKMSADVKKQLVKQAAINTGITVGLTALGPATLGISAVLAGLYAAVIAVVGAKYKRQSEELIGNFQDEIKVKMANADARIADNDRKIMREQEPAARALALSPVALNGLDGLDGWLGDRLNVVKGYASDIMRDPAKTIKTAVMRPVRAAQTVANQVVPPAVMKVYKSVAQPIEDTANRVYNAAEDARDTLSGRGALEATDKEITKARVTADRLIEENTTKILADHESPRFRNEVTVMMAKAIRSDANIQAMIDGNNSTPGGNFAAPGTQVTMPSKKLALLPMAGAAAGVLAFGFLKG